MNHPTMEAEELYSLAQEAMAHDDAQQAVVFLRKAARLAPLRRDVRNLLAKALEWNNSSSSTAVATFETPVAFADTQQGSSEFVKRAVAAAASTGIQATAATQRLSNLLEQGLRSWKSSGFKASSLAQPADPSTRESRSLSDSVEDLRAYLQSLPAEEAKLAPTDSYRHLNNDHRYEEDESDEQEEAFQARPMAEPLKSTSALPKTRNRRNKDIEDSLAAGIDAVVTKCQTIGKVRFLYSFVYFCMALFVGIACFDVSKKFSPVLSGGGSGTATNGQNQAASLGFQPAEPTTLDVQAISDDQKTIQDGLALAGSGQIDQAIELFDMALKSGARTSNRDQIRVELARLLDARGGSRLTANQLELSVADYKKATQLQPRDATAALHLGNALFYRGSLKDDPKARIYLKEALEALNTAVRLSPGSVQAHQMLATTHEAFGNKDSAKSSWKRVLALAAKGSDASKTAERKLKKQS